MWEGTGEDKRRESEDLHYILPDDGSYIYLKGRAWQAQTRNVERVPVGGA